MYTMTTSEERHARTPYAQKTSRAGTQGQHTCSWRLQQWRSPKSSEFLEVLVAGAVSLRFIRNGIGFITHAKCSGVNESSETLRQEHQIERGGQ